MDNLALYKDWLANEEAIAGLLATLKPLLERRHAFEEKDPRLGLLRDDRVAPGETAPPPLPTSAQLLNLRPTTLLKGSGAPLQGLPDRQVPTIEEFQKLVEKKKAKNRKTHEKQKAKRKQSKKSVEEDDKNRPEASGN